MDPAGGRKDFDMESRREHPAARDCCGAQHVHMWVNVADDPSVKLNA
jgi:hypothetical protein